MDHKIEIYNSEQNLLRCSCGRVFKPFFLNEGNLLASNYKCPNDCPLGERKFALRRNETDSAPTPEKL